MKKIDETLDFIPKFNKDGLLPAIVFDINSKSILMLAYMNEESLLESINSGFATYWSRSRKCLWKKGETSGNMQEIKEILLDCDQDTIILNINQIGSGACHTGKKTCFYRRIPLSINKNTKLNSLTNLKLKAI